MKVRKKNMNTAFDPLRTMVVVNGIIQHRPPAEIGLGYRKCPFYYEQVYGDISPVCLTKVLLSLSLKTRQCRAVTKSGERCKNRVSGFAIICRCHRCAKPSNTKVSKWRRYLPMQIGTGEPIRHVDSSVKLQSFIEKTNSIYRADPVWHSLSAEQPADGALCEVYFPMGDFSDGTTVGPMTCAYWRASSRSWHCSDYDHELTAFTPTHWRGIRCPTRLQLMGG